MRKYQNQKIPGNCRLFGVRFFWKINFSKDFQRKLFFLKFSRNPKKSKILKFKKIRKFSKNMKIFKLKIKMFRRDFFKSHGVPALLSIMKRNVTILVSNSKKYERVELLSRKMIFKSKKTRKKCYLVTILLFKISAAHDTANTKSIQPCLITEGFS